MASSSERTRISAVVPADLRVRVDLLEGALVDHGADVCVVLPAGPQAHLLDACDEARRELVVDGFVHDHAARGRTALAGGAERGPDDAVDREIEFGVVHDDDRVLAAEIEVDVLEVVGSGPSDGDARLARAGEGDDRNVRMLDQPLADVRAAAVNDVED